MWRQALAILVSCAVMFGGQSAPATIKAKVMDIPTGSIVEVRTHKKSVTKGRLTAVTDEHFTVQSATTDKVLSNEFRFEDTKSVKMLKVKGEEAGKASSKIGWIVLGGLAAIGVIAVVGLVALASNGY